MNAYKVLFPSSSLEKSFDKVLSRISSKIRTEIIQKVEQLGLRPVPAESGSFKRLNPPVEVHALTAHYRLRIGDYRVLYDVDHGRKIVWILALRKRDEQTYRN